MPHVSAIMTVQFAGLPDSGLKVQVMSRPLIVFAAVVLLVAYASSALPDQWMNHAVREHFSVSPVGQSAVLVDSQTGRTWLLQRPASDYMPAVWVPMRRLDDKEEVLRWRAEQAEQRTLPNESVESPGGNHGVGSIGMVSAATHRSD